MFCSSILLLLGAQILTVYGQQQCYGMSVNLGQDISPGTHDIQVFQNSTDLADCCNLCRANPACQAFVYETSSQSCFLKDVSQPRVANDNLVAGVRWSGESTCGNQCTDVNSGFDISPLSHNIANQVAMDLESCCDFCKKTAACQAFVWVKATGQCYLKDVSVPRVRNDNVISGLRGSSVTSSPPPADQCTGVNSGLDISPRSHDIVSQVGMDLEGCCNYCQKTALCKAFVWVKSTGQCWLKDTDTPRVASQDLISGLRGPGLNQCSSVNSGLDISPGTNDLINRDGTDLAGCCDFCETNPTCKAFVWVKATGKC